MYKYVTYFYNMIIIGLLSYITSYHYEWIKSSLVFSTIFALPSLLFSYEMISFYIPFKYRFLISIISSLSFVSSILIFSQYINSDSEKIFLFISNFFIFFLGISVLLYTTLIKMKEEYNKK